MRHLKWNQLCKLCNHWSMRTLRGSQASEKPWGCSDKTKQGAKISPFFMKNWILIPYSGINAHAPSALRVAVHCTLQAVTTQADRVRQLFSPLTLREELSQMSEMYGPPSPPTGKHLLSHTTTPSIDGAPGSQLRRSFSSSKLDKRTTWSGSSSLRSRDSYTKGAYSAIPPLPSAIIKSPFEDSQASFGALALDLQRTDISPWHSAFSSPSSLRTSPNASRFTPMHTSRSPLLTTALNSSLHGALSSKRYACAHLLALRFHENEDEQYWEDVRSVIALLRTSLEDEAARLSEAIENWHRSRERDSRPSITSTPSAIITEHPLPKRRRPRIPSFAPQQPDSAKFVAHMESVSGALDRAYDELESCVSAFQKHSSDDSPDNENVQRAMNAYENLRRELGNAFRESERARSPFLSVMTNKVDIEEDEPALSPMSSTELNSHIPDTSAEEFQLDSPSRAGAHSPPPAYVSRGSSQIVDDVTAHLLAGATAMHLPPPGADRVFEAESGPFVKPYTKERSKLSRQERIALSKITRPQPSPRGASALQPLFLTGEVVQELKEVLNRVNERKQRLSMQASPTLETLVEPPISESQNQISTNFP